MRNDETRIPKPEGISNDEQLNPVVRHSFELPASSFVIYCSC
jgi:hypothetical protein